MDLVQSIRKQGSRGGRDEFKWDDVKTSVHRENYLGHSLMAPVGRWQKNKDLSWYAKGDGEADGKSEADIRREEIQRVKEAEERAMARALGREPPPSKEDNANFTDLGRDREVQRTIQQSAAEADGEWTGNGLGYGKYDSRDKRMSRDEEVIEGTRGGRGGLDREHPHTSRRSRHDAERRHDRARRRDRHRSGSQEAERHRDDRRGRDYDRRPRHRHSESRSRSLSRDRRRSRSRERRREERRPEARRDNSGDRRYRHRDAERRSRSPVSNRDSGSYRRRQRNRTDTY